MRRTSSNAVSVGFVLLIAAGGCESSLGGGANPGPGVAGSGGAVAGSGGSGSNGTGGSATGGASGSGGSTGGMDARPDVVVAPADAGGCGAYPVAPEITATRFMVGTVLPNLSFKREDGTPVTLADLRCNKKHRLMYWSVGGDLCIPCVGEAREIAIPAWRELGPQGLLVMESFNGARGLVTEMPYPNWRRQTMWPPDGESILLVEEPRTMPYYVHLRISNGIPETFIVDLETMKVVSRSRDSVATLRMRLAATPMRP